MVAALRAKLSARECSASLVVLPNVPSARKGLTVISFTLFKAESLPVVEAMLVPNAELADTRTTLPAPTPRLPVSNGEYYGLTFNIRFRKHGNRSQHMFS